MEYGNIIGISRPVSRIFFGTAVGPMLAGENMDAVLDGALEQGINAFDCARSYGQAENVLGDWIRRRGCRDQVTVLSKCGDIRNGVVHVDAQVIREQLEASLRTLKAGVIDLYLLHRDDPLTPVGEMIDELNRAVKEGKIRAFGVSNWKTDRIREADAYAERTGQSGFAVSSPNWGLARQMDDLWGGGCVTISGPEHAADRAWYAETGMPVIAYSSLGRGFFSGKFRAFDEAGARSVLDSYAQKGYLYPENMRRLRNAEILAEKKNASVAKIAMAYALAGEMNVFAVVSTTKAERLAESAEAAEMRLTAEETAFLEEDA